VLLILFYYFSWVLSVSRCGLIIDRSHVFFHIALLMCCYFIDLCENKWCCCCCCCCCWWWWWQTERNI